MGRRRMTWQVSHGVGSDDKQKARLIEFADAIVRRGSCTGAWRGGDDISTIPAASKSEPKVRPLDLDRGRRSVEFTVGCEVQNI